MRRILVWAASTLTVLVLLLGYHTSTSSRVPLGAESSQVGGVTSDDDGSGSASDDGSSGASAGSGSGSSADSGSGSSSKTTTVKGSAVETQWGPVQVTITVRDGKVTASDATVGADSNPQHQRINAYAVPILDKETVAAQSADIDMVSGATITSDAYRESLQAALDSAGLS